MTTYGDLLEIADTLVARGHTAIGRIEVRVGKMSRQLTLAEQVAGGLVLKMQSSFEALVEDVHGQRGEAMHHLKTLCEVFFYFYEAAASDKRAAIVLAYAHEKRAERGRDPWHPDPSLAAEATARRDALMQGVALPGYIWSVKKVANRHPNLRQWYAGVYQLACEPAHISDLEDFRPKQDLLPTGQSTFRLRRAFEAAYHGIAIMLAVVEYWNAYNHLDHAIDVQDIRARFSVWQ